ncbi:MAG: hypothetical protein HUU10_10585 [Bacteroidetes bacterium]|nr:hypothetical protein [Bacteroidota bacterium]
MTLKRFLLALAIIAGAGLLPGLLLPDYQSELLTGNLVMGGLALLNGLAGWLVIRKSGMQGTIALISIGLLVKMMVVALVLIIIAKNGQLSLMASGLSLIGFYCAYTTIDVWFLYRQTQP